MSTIAHFIEEEAGATAVDYGLLAAATILAVVAILPILGSSVNATFTAFNGNLE